MLTAILIIAPFVIFWVHLFWYERTEYERVKNRHDKMIEDNEKIDKMIEELINKD